MKNSENNQQFIFTQIKNEPIEFNKLFAHIEGIVVLEVLDDRMALIELNEIQREDLLNKFNNFLIEPNILYFNCKR